MKKAILAQQDTVTNYKIITQRMKRLHYASLNDSEIQTIEINEYDELVNEARKRMLKAPKQVVYVFTFECIGDVDSEYSEVFVTENNGYILGTLEREGIAGIDFSLDCTDFFIQEYNSYEEAYKVALAMKETSRLCYSDIAEKNQLN